MPVVSNIDPKSKRKIKRYVATAENFRLQLAALPDKKDENTGRVIRGKSLVAQFKGGMFKTNIPEMIKEIEASYAFENGDVKDYDNLIVEAKEARYNDLLALAKDDPELLARLKKDLVGDATEEQKERAGKLIAEVESEAVKKE